MSNDVLNVMTKNMSHSVETQVMRMLLKALQQMNTTNSQYSIIVSIIIVCLVLVTLSIYIVRRWLQQRVR